MIHLHAYHVDWTKASFSQRKAHVEVLLESLEHRDAVIRFTNARRLFYILQGFLLSEFLHVTLTQSGYSDA